MPLWAGAYTAFYVIVTLYSIRENRREGEGIAYILTDSATDVFAILLIVAYWSESTADALGLFLPCAFASSIAWEAFSIPYELRKAVDGAADLDVKTKKAAIVVGMLATILLSAPIYIWGAIVSWEQLR